MITTPADDDFFTYSSSALDDSVTITATLRPGLENTAVAPGATTTWTFDTTFTPVTILTPEDLTYTVNWTTRLATITNPTVDTFLRDQNATYTFTSNVTQDYTFAVFDNDTGLQVGDEFTATTTSTNHFSITEADQGLAFVFTSEERVDAYQTAQDHFGPLGDTGYMATLSNSEPTAWSVLTATYLDECGTSQTVSARGPGIPPRPQDPSDARLKTDIVDLGVTANGFTLYAFRYIDGDTFGNDYYVGVMAQEVIKTRPDAVTTGDDGYYRVSYDKLGLRMLTFNEYILGLLTP